MRAILAIILFLEGVLVSAVLDKINIKGVEIPLIYEEYKGLPIVSSQVIIKNAGSIADGQNAGIARFTAGMLGEGSATKGAVGFATELENRAISLGTHAGSETFVFELSSLKEQFDFSMQMLGELLGDPNFSQESFDKVAQLTLGNLSSKKSDFDYIANLNLKKMIFAGTPLGQASSGEIDDIKKLTLKDVQAFYKGHLTLANMMIVVGGDISLPEVKAAFEKLLSDIPVGAQSELGYYGASAQQKEQTERKETEQAYIYFGAPYHLKSDDVDAYKAKVAGFILGESGFGSRLMEEIRVKRGLAYSAYSRTNINRSNSYFSGHLQTKNENLKESMALVKSEIKRFVSGGVTQAELDQAKKFLLGSEPLRNETLSQRLSRAFTEHYRGFALGYSKEQLDLIEKLSLEDLNNFIKAHDEINALSFSIVTNAQK